MKYLNLKGLSPGISIILTFLLALFFLDRGYEYDIHGLIRY